MINNEAELFEYMRVEIPDLTKTRDRYEAYDFYSNYKLSLFEVKVRKTHYDQLVIEKAKYDSVLAEAEKLGYTPFYVSATPNGVFCFNLYEVDVDEWSVKAMPQTTEFANRKTIPKIVGYLDVCDSIKI